MSQPVIFRKSYVSDIPAAGYWDQTLVDALVGGHLWPRLTPQYRIADVSSSGAVFVVPGARQLEAPDALARLNEDLSKFERVVLVITSDETANFPWQEVKHPSLRLWVQYFDEKKHTDPNIRPLPVGYSPKTRLTPQIDKTVPWAFLGQCNTKERKMCLSVVNQRTDGDLLITPGFLRGVDPDAYLRRLAAAKLALCPGGAHHPDTFRTWEALELGCVPIVGARGPVEVGDYWGRLFGSYGPFERPFPIIYEWSEMPAKMEALLSQWPEISNTTLSWYLGFKRRLVTAFENDVRWLANEEPIVERGSRLIVVMPTSPIASHPDTTITDQTLGSVLERPELEKADVIVMCDGVREKQAHYTERYTEYLRRLLLRALRESSFWPRVFPTHHHQAAMTKESLSATNRPALLFVEHDTPLILEWPVEQLIDCVIHHGADVVRCHHEVRVLEVHEHLMLDREAKQLGALPVRRTVQWSQRPHIASTGFYRRILETEFDLPREKFMIEDRMYGRVEEAWRQFGEAGWHRYHLFMYTPEGNIQRSVHLDGRGADHKWVDE